MKIALAQINSLSGERDPNLEVVASFIESASALGADLVIFPEMSDTGYVEKAIVEGASEWSNSGSSAERISTLSSKFSINVAIGLAEREGRGIYNALGVFSPDGGLLAKYRKKNLFSSSKIDEESFLNAGSQLATFDFKDFRFGLSICYDLRFPELFSELAFNKVNVFINVSAWPMLRADHWRCLSMARAIENQSYFLGVNQVGCSDGTLLDGGLSDGKNAEALFAGNSIAISPRGEVLKLASETESELICIDLRKKEVDDFRQEIGSLKARIAKRESPS